MKIANDWWDAVKRADLEEIRTMLADGIDVDFRDKEGWTALMFVALEGRVELGRFLVRKGADINATSFGGFSGTTALMVAASCGHTEFVRMALDHGADVTKRGPLGGTALAFAAFRGHREIMQMLILRGADMRSGNIYEDFHRDRVSPETQHTPSAAAPSYREDSIALHSENR